MHLRSGEYLGGYSGDLELSEEMDTVVTNLGFDGLPAIN